MKGEIISRPSIPPVQPVVASKPQIQPAKPLDSPESKNKSNEVKRLTWLFKALCTFSIIILKTTSIATWAW